MVKGVIGLQPPPRTLLVFVFFLSGMDSLIYQVAWQRLLTVYYGVGPISTALIVTIFMLGLGVGALCGGALAERVRARIRVYMAIELMLGFFGWFSLPYLEFLGGSTAGSSYQATAVWMALFLIIPTLLMGMTLPLIVKIFSGRFEDFLGTVAFLYFINTLGAAVGALVASYGIISFLGLDRCIYIAAAINLFLASLIAWAGRGAAGESAAPSSLAAPDAGASAPVGPVHGLGRTAWLVVLITGFLAIGYEIVWFRVMEVLVKASPYAFSTVLAVYLCAIALGSFAMHRALPRSHVEDQRSVFFLLQFLTGCLVALSFVGYYVLTVHTRFGALTRASFWRSLHPSFELPSLEHPSLVFSSVDILIWPLFFVFVPALLIGASFPLISSLARSKADQEGRTVGTVYFFNTLGNALGGLATGFILLPVLKTERTILVFLSVNLLMGLFVTTVAGRRLPIAARSVVVLGLLGLAVAIFPRPGQLYAAMHSPVGHHERTFQEEGIEGIVYTTQDGEHIGNYINGLVHGGRPNPGFYAEAVEALSCTQETRNILIIGFGTGSFVEVMEQQPEVRKITLVELNDTLMRNLRRIPLFHNMLSDPRLDLIIDDGRRYLLRTDEKFDLVLIDPLWSTTAYSNNLYSREFFTLVRQHLKPEGVFLVWTDEMRVLPKTVGSAFPHLRFYSWPPRFGFTIVSTAPLKRDEGRWSRVLATFPPEMQPRIRREAITYLGDSAYVESISRGLPINEDRRPVCEYYLGLKTRQAGLAPPPQVEE
ncbi:MAG TPA: hypothetical protein VFF52_15645 [Isosphaeraceae bacterium]|nr:hypothetical protein [Isosphaeraceae bacterium]